jgi:hypothetical protein
MALILLTGVTERLLIGAVADGHPLRADSQSRRVHHHEHGGEAAILLADQPRLCALVVAKPIFVQLDPWRITWGENGVNEEGGLSRKGGGGRQDAKLSKDD